MNQKEVPRKTPKPTWDATTTDQTRYKLSEKEVLKRKIIHMSKNAVLAKQEIKLKGTRKYSQNQSGTNTKDNQSSSRDRQVRSPNFEKENEPFGHPGAHSTQANKDFNTSINANSNTAWTNRSAERGGSREKDREASTKKQIFGTSRRFWQQPELPDPKQR
eukprot:CAMPEP_0116894550 /NCGR_PEP_ID=MMETSP0467-20121206/4302_1 /TAXON_ID=283647 /ORGANISM="Mesodinium pulex, Strain SPMC105" /LENGTH=160 /DNA_ID=CAMNT_0004564849 /DNA_START=68 /DNA_END=550 /DNA_ORIENTATION=-